MSKNGFRLTQRMTSGRVVETSTNNNSASQASLTPTIKVDRQMWPIEKDHGNSDSNAIVLTQKRMERKITCVDCLGAFDGF